jgi:hypothetical protein
VSLTCFFLQSEASQKSCFLAVWDVIPQDQKTVVISFLKHLQLLANMEGMQLVRAHLLMSFEALLCANQLSTEQHRANASHLVMMLTGLSAEKFAGLLSLTQPSCSTASVMHEDNGPDHGKNEA